MSADNDYPDTMEKMIAMGVLNGTQIATYDNYDLMAIVNEWLLKPENRAKPFGILTGGESIHNLCSWSLFATEAERDAALLEILPRFEDCEDRDISTPEGLNALMEDCTVVMRVSWDEMFHHNMPLPYDIYFAGPDAGNQLVDWLLNYDYETNEWALVRPGTNELIANGIGPIELTNVCLNAAKNGLTIDKGRYNDFETGGYKDSAGS